MKHFLKLTLILSILIFSSACDKDDEQDESPQVSMAATINLRDANGVLSSNPWSLPNVSATRRNGNITITAYNTESGEVFTLRVPDDGPAYYSNTSADNDPGYGSWRRNANSLTWYSNDLPEGTPGNFAVDLVEVNEGNNTITGTFFMPVFSPLNEMNAFFQNGTFSNVPIIISEENDAITENRVSFKVNGINFNPISIVVNQIENATELIVTATNATDGTLIFALPLNAVDSTQYTVGEEEGEVSINLQQPPFDPAPGLSGNLVIESHNQGAKTMSGTFEFEAGQLGIANQSITDGVFEVIYE
jgi:hypothetical protein